MTLHTFYSIEDAIEFQKKIESLYAEYNDPDGWIYIGDTRFSRGTNRVVSKISDT